MCSLVPSALSHFETLHTAWVGQYRWTTKPTRATSVTQTCDEVRLIQTHVLSKSQIFPAVANAQAAACISGMTVYEKDRSVTQCAEPSGSAPGVGYHFIRDKWNPLQFQDYTMLEKAEAELFGRDDHLTPSLA